MAADHSSSRAPPALAPVLSGLEAWRSRPDRGRSIPEGIWDSAAVQEIVWLWDPIGVQPGEFAPADESDSYDP